ncbi:non-ribosomal peptide synthetase [Massilia sp. H-1]|nr:non-ribosomal peptide synthetase [Massilia sp. H-1]
MAPSLLTRGRYSPTSILIGGEALGKASWDKLRASTTTHFYNMYGPTECTVDATIGEINGEGPQPHIGRPIANMQIHILDAHGQLAPCGSAGELHIGGTGVARGYLHRPELTAERFIADPFSSKPGARLYKTGDLGRWLPDGTVDYIGRNDFQVKLRGFRIELGEIEAKLRACDGVRDAVVVAREDTPGDKRLVAYLLARDGAEPSARALREQLATELSEYMIPSAFVTLDAWPLTPNGKLDRRALPAPDLNAVAALDYQAPQGELECRIAAVWQELLGLEQVGRNDQFFELGGHSLMVIILIDRLRQQDLNLDVNSVFSAPTVAGMAALLAATVPVPVAAVPVPPVMVLNRCDPHHAGDAADGGPDPAADRPHRGWRACKARPTFRISIRSDRCSRGSCSTTCWRAKATPI